MLLFLLLASLTYTRSLAAPHTTYLLTVNNVRDRAATPNTILPNTQQSFSIDGSALDIALLRPYPEPISASSRHGPIIFSEIMYHPPPRPDGKNLEFVELYNSNPFSEDISGFRLTGQVEFTFPTNTVIAARSFLAVAAAPADLLSVWGAMNLLGPYTNSLSNRSGTLRLRNRQGGILLEVNYSSEPPWPAAPPWPTTTSWPARRSAWRSRMPMRPWSSTSPASPCWRSAISTR